MFNPAFQTKNRSKTKIGTFIIGLLAVVLGLNFLAPNLTGAAIYQSGEVQSFEPIFILIAGIILTFIIALLWWWISKKKAVAPRM